MPILHSRPGAPRIIYLDFDGHSQNNAKGFGAFTALPYDPSKNGAAFDDTEKRQMALIWQRVAEDYIIFDVDVTTEEPPVFNATTSRCVVTRSTDATGAKMPSSSAAGIAFVGIFGSTQLQAYGPALGELDSFCRL